MLVEKFMSGAEEVRGGPTGEYHDHDAAEEAEEGPHGLPVGAVVLLFV